MEHWIEGARMTLAALIPDLWPAPSVVIDPAHTRRKLVVRTRRVRRWLHSRAQSADRSTITIVHHPASPERHDGPARPIAQVALADAVRQQLTRPGSVPPHRQLQLIMADRAGYGFDAGAIFPNYHWTPFLHNVDANPHRPLARNDCPPTTPHAAEQDAWWDRPFEDFSTR
jgi:hypothetical protein